VPEAKRPHKTARATADVLDSPLANPQEAERTLVGWLLVEPARAAEVVGAGVSSRHFHQHLTRETFAAIERLVERGELPTPDNVFAELWRKSVRDVSKVDLFKLADGMPRGVPWSHHAALVREGAARRQLAYLLRDQVDVCGSEDLAAIRASLYAALDDGDLALRPPAFDRWETLSAELGATYDAGEEPLVPSGLKGPDVRFGEWPRGSLVIVGARTSIGKTSLATTLAVEHAKAGRRVSFISVEMDAHRIGQRYVGAISGVSLHDLVRRRLGESDDARLRAALAEPLALCTDDRSRSWSAVRARIRQHARELGGVDVVFVDYVQLIDPEPKAGEKRYEAIGRLSMGMKHLARDLDCVIVAMAQLNRGTEEREEPRMSDLRESGNLEQDADIVWLLWRKEKDVTLYGLSPVRLKVAKNRYGPTGEIKLRFRSSAMQFLELEEDE